MMFRSVQWHRAALLTIAFTLMTGCGDNNALPDLDARTEPVLKKIDPQTEQQDVKVRKARFFEQLRPVVDAENERTLAIRAALKSLRDKAESGELTAGENAWLNDVASRYKIEADAEGRHDFATLLRRVDVVPVSLALSQAAMESAWGRSRFAQEGNNLFGQWCFSKGCGIVPSQRAAGLTHEVAKFKTVNAAVRAYLENLNRHPTYVSLRDVRQGIRRGRVTKTPGIDMAVGLENYSELGNEYVEHISSVIRQNKLSQYNRHLVQGMPQ